jgi:UV DNA damage endonuclease
VRVIDGSGMYGDKGATLARFKENYVKLSDPVKKRLVLENDDMCWSVEDLLPTCQELGIPMVLVQLPLFILTEGLASP